MDEFEKLRSELLAVTNISALAREAGLSRRQIQRIRGGKVPNTTLKTMTSIRKGIVALRAAEKRAA